MNAMRYGAADLVRTGELRRLDEHLRPLVGGEICGMKPAPLRATVAAELVLLLPLDELAEPGRIAIASRGDIELGGRLWPSSPVLKLIATRWPQAATALLKAWAAAPPCHCRP